MTLRTLLTLALALATMASAAQRTRKPTTPAPPTPDSLRTLQMLSAVERIIVVDSTLIPKQQLTQALAISPETGHYNATATTFTTQMGDRQYLTLTDTLGRHQLHSADILFAEPQTPQPLPGLEEWDAINPFPMADGLTLYFAAQTPDNLGGWDLFMTRYDPYTQQYLTPQNIGMPFNSHSNDILLCIDEVYNIGTLVTDRCQEQTDTLCIYYFIPSTTRHTYNPDETNPTQLRRLARIAALKDTWADPEAVRAAKARLEECLNTQ